MRMGMPTISMKCIVDASVLLPLLCEGHPRGRAAYTWFDSRGPGSVGWSLAVRVSVLRLLSNERIMGSSVLLPEEALGAWAALARDERMVEVSQVPPTLELYLKSNVAGRRPSPKLWIDAWLAALAESLGHEMVTCDSEFTRFELSALHVIEEG